MRVVLTGTVVVLWCALGGAARAQSINLLSANGDVVRDWSARLDLVSGEHEATVDGRTVWHVHTMRPDGSQRETWTGRGAGAPPATCHHGFAHFHPSGRYLLMSVESDDDRQRPCGSNNSVPGVAAFANLWVVDLESGAWTNLTNYSGWRRGLIYGALSPYFSPDGTQVVWSKLAKPSTRQRDKVFGEWELHVATFNWQGTPRLEDDRVLMSEQLYESHGFSPDGRKLLFSSDVGLAFSGGLDLFELDLASGDARNLTNTPEAYDEHARYSPDGQWVVWGSGEGVEGQGAERTFWSEVNVMRLDGSERRRLTNSNLDGQPESCGGCGSWPTTWSPDGRQVLFAQQMFPIKRQPDRMWRVDVARAVAPGSVPRRRRRGGARAPAAGSSAQPTGPIARGEYPEKTLRVNGATRVYRLVVSSSIPADRPAPLVVALHGLAIDNKDVMPRYTKLNDTAQAHGFILAYPNAVGGSWGIGPFKIRNDVAFFDALVADISGAYRVDPQRIYLVGMSNGGYFAQHLAKVRSTVVAAVATHSGQRGIDSLRIKADRKYAVLIVHGVDDRVFSIEGARRNRDGYRREGHVAELVELPGTGHEWGAAHGVNETIWRFFAAHPKG